jgi:hypothetical protein
MFLSYRTLLIFSTHLYQQGITFTEATAVKRAAVNIYVFVAGEAKQTHKYSLL